MKDRIVQIMEQEGMTSARFADSIGVKRSIMSHILSGRNNPSLDVLLKIISRFEYLSTDWVLFGKEPMFKHQLSPNAYIAGEQPQDEFAFEMMNHDDITGDADEPVSGDNTPSSAAEIKRPAPLKVPPGRRVSKIMVFYSDNTFENFIPESGPRK